MKQQILDLILTRPNIRTVEIADRIDCDVESVRPLIADELRSGVIVEEDIRAPNGRIVQSFRYANAVPVAEVVKVLPPEPLPARVLRALPPTERPTVPRAQEPKPAPKPAQAPAPKPAPAPVAAPVPTPTAAQAAAEPLEIDVPVSLKPGVTLAAPPASGKAKSRVDMALDCLRAAGGQSVTSGRLIEAMGVPKHHSPSSYLKFALKDGRVARSENGWIAGPALLGDAVGACAVGFAGEPAPNAVELPEPMVSVRATPSDVALVEPTATVAPAPVVVSEQPAVQVAPDATAPKEHYPAPSFLASQAEAVRIGGSSNYPLPPVVEGAPDITRNGLYENGEFRKPADELLIVGGIGVSGGPSESVNIGQEAANEPAPKRFLAGVMSDGSLYLSVPGNAPMSLTPDQGRELFEFLRKMGYAAWPTAA